MLRSYLTPMVGVVRCGVGEKVARLRWQDWLSVIDNGAGHVVTGWCTIEAYYGQTFPRMLQVHHADPFHL